MQRHSKRLKRQICFGLLTLSSTIFALGFYSGLKVTQYTFTSSRLPDSFDGFRIAFLSDLHGNQFGSGQKKLLSSIHALQPDIIVFTGDMIDGRHTDLSPIRELLAGLYGTYPVYAVHGNHEYDNPSLLIQLLDLYQNYDVQILEDQQVTIERFGQTISLSGLSFRNAPTGQELRPNSSLGSFHILLYHDASAFSWSSLLGYDLILSGHVHGGVIRLPLLGGLLSPDATFFPPYDRGRFDLYRSTMYASAGLGSAVIPRFYNRPELVLLTLKQN